MRYTCFCTMRKIHTALTHDMFRNVDGALWLAGCLKARSLSVWGFAGVSYYEYECKWELLVAAATPATDKLYAMRERARQCRDGRNAQSVLLSHQRPENQCILHSHYGNKHHTQHEDTTQHVQHEPEIKKYVVVELDGCRVHNSICQRTMEYYIHDLKFASHAWRKKTKRVSRDMSGKIMHIVWVR